MSSLLRLNTFKSVSRTTANVARAQPYRFKTTYSHSTSKTVKTEKDVNTDQKAFNEEISQEELNEMKKFSDEFAKKQTSEKASAKYSKGFKDLKDKGNRTAEEQNRPEDYM